MYAERSNRRFPINPNSMAAALAINGGVLAALFMAAPELIPISIDPPPTVMRNIPVPPEPVPIEPEPLPSASAEIARIDPAPRPQPLIPDSVISVPSPDRPIFEIGTLPPPQLPIGAGGTGAGSTPRADPAPPVLVDAAPDSRYLADFQPDYPASERREARDGRVVVRVLIGSDGRVKAVERVSATSDAFFDATRQRALGRWRFTPATRDGVKIESWHRMTVRFVMEN